MNTKKLKAFTLSELLVVLVISSIVISLTFVILGLVQKQIIEIQLNLKDQQEIQFLEKIMLKEIHTHDAFFSEEKEELHLFNANDTLKYTFLDTFITRKKDTFNLTVLNKAFFLDGEKIKKGWLDAVQITFKQSYTSKVFFIFKTKDAAHYLNH
jgi:prepilin-type N-terminal cleavage/methylation domain-containing protein